MRMNKEGYEIEVNTTLHKLIIITIKEQTDMGDEVTSKFAFKDIPSALDFVDKLREEILDHI